MSEYQYEDALGSTRVGTKYETLHLPDGSTLSKGDVVGVEDPDTGDERDNGNAYVSMRLFTGRVDSIFETAHGPEVIIAGGPGRIPVEDLQIPAERFDRFMASAAQNCLIEEWLAETSSAPDDYDLEDEYVATEK